MSFGQDLFEGFELPSQPFGRIVVMVKMHLNLAKARPAQRGQCVNVPRFVFVLRIEERMPRRPAIAIAEIAEKAGIIVEPVLDPFIRNRRSGVTTFGLIMVGDA